MELWLVDINLAIVEAWKQAFTEFDDVYIKHGNILEIAENTIVSPTRS